MRHLIERPAHGSKCRYKDQELNSCIWFLSFVIFSMIQWNDYFSSVDVSMVCRIILKSCVLLCGLFYLCVIKLKLFTIKLSLPQYISYNIFN